MPSTSTDCISSLPNYGLSLMHPSITLCIHTISYLVWALSIPCCYHLPCSGDIVNPYHTKHTLSQSTKSIFTHFTHQVLNLRPWFHDNITMSKRDQKYYTWLSMPSATSSCRSCPPNFGLSSVKDPLIVSCIYTISYFTMSPQHTVIIPSPVEVSSWIHTIPHYAIACHTISYHTMPCQSMPYHTILCHSMPHHIIP